MNWNIWKCKTCFFFSLTFLTLNSIKSERENLCTCSLEGGSLCGSMVSAFRSSVRVWRCVISPSMDISSSWCEGFSAQIRKQPKHWGAEAGLNWPRRAAAWTRSSRSGSAPPPAPSSRPASPSPPAGGSGRWRPAWRCPAEAAGLHGLTDKRHHHHQAGHFLKWWEKEPAIMNSD